ncbi:MAG: ABC transporter ATP-binding protein [Chloroflexi bacterium AL-W]|nr:ABC transporter ATP-binding protein [Chloroflexi bacterium AL-N1]NOK70074.1 ABC transporter ATP-binding protein [Chloroflexi bacterium AL-N10]NOK77914.1 ABC transporter ATP-binding protein [Chloroflexi bacterium AL-N5]NOK84923.1 ABC transporter ATP-binding protein [Chloroflexi bacterium AL-W]NOK91902.1 ABC transporter ATP-binding protein [Chloroflexi bacterium AL-N15]
MPVSLTNLTKYYGNFCVLDHVSLQIEGGMFGLLGPNGSGKTTLMRLLATILRPSAGQMFIDNIDVLRHPARIRAQLGYLPQDFGFYKRLTAYETLSYIATMKQIARAERHQQIRQVLEQVNLIDVARRRVGGFSGGMCQRLGIAQALLGNPPLLIVDEPTAGLDPEERLRLRNLLVRLATQRTVLLSTHIVADIEASCTALAVLNQGRLVFTGTLTDLVEQARGRVWQVETTPEQWEQLHADLRIVSSRSSGAKMLLRVLADDLPLAGATSVEPGLEDGYMAVMHGVRPAEVVHA